VFGFSVLSGIIGCKQGTSSTGSFIQNAANITTGTGTTTGAGAPIILAGRIVDAVTNLGVNSSTVKTEGGQVSTTQNNGIRDGIFAIPNVPIGTYNIVSSKANYESAIKQVTIGAEYYGKTVDIGDVILYPLGSPNAGTIKGQVLDNADKLGENGVKIAIESGLSTLSANDGVKDGAYIINNAPVGTYSITLTKAGYATKIDSVTVGRLQTVTKDVIIAATTETSGGGTVITTTRTITGQVLDKTSLLGLDGVQVRTEGGLVTTTANDGIRSGVFTIANVPVASYYLFFSKLGYIDSKLYANIVSGTGAQEIIGASIEAVARETGTLKGQATDATSRQGLNDVTVTLEGGLSVITSNNGIINGAYQFEKTAPVGKYTVTFQRSGYLTSTSDKIEVNPGSVIELNQAMIRSQSDPDKATITGTVEDISREDGVASAPNQKVYVYLLDSVGAVVKLNGETVDTYSALVPTNEDENGKYTLINVPPGTYSVIGRLPNYQDGRVDNVVATAGGVIENITLQLKGILGSISGVIYQDINDDKQYTNGIDFPLAAATIEIDGTDHKEVSRINGTYTITNVNIGDNYILVAGASIEGRGRYLQNYIDGVNVTPLVPNVTNVNIWLAPASSLAGVGHVDGFVKDIYGKALDSATVEVDPGGANNKTVFTQSDGFFFIRDISAGTYILKARKDNYSSKTQIVNIPADNTSYSVPDSRDKGFWLQPNKSSVSGMVFNDVNGNGTYDAGTDTTIDKAALSVYYGGPSNPADDPDGKSDAESANNGMYTLYNIPYGQRIIKVTHPDFSSAQLLLSVNAAIMANQNIGMLSKIGNVSGVVINDLNGNNALDAGDTPLASVNVVLVGQSSETYVTGNDGVFVFNSIPIGDYTIQVTKSSYGSNSRFVQIVPNSSNPVSPVYVGLNQQLGSVAGRIVELSADANTEGPAIEGATVEIQGLATPKTKSSVGSGEFLLGGLNASPSGTDYTIQAFSQTYEASSVTLSQQSKLVMPGQTTAGVVISLKRKTGTITGIVSEGSSGSAVSGATVILSNSGLSVVTGADGSYSFKDVPIYSNYQMEVILEGYSKGSASSIVVQANQQTSQDFALTLGAGSVVGLITDATTGSAISGISVEIMGKEWKTLSLSNGSYRLTNVNQGSFTVIAYSASFEATLRNDVPVTAGKVTPDINFQLQRLTGKIAGRIETNDLIPAPVEGALVRIENTSYSANSAADGTYAIDSVLIGSGYQLKVFKNKYTSGLKNNVAVTANETTTADFVLTKARGAITGLVVEKDSSIPLDGITVEISGTAYKTRTASGGIYLITNVSAGDTYTLVAYGNSYETSSLSPVKVVEDATTKADNIQLVVKKGSIVGVVRDSVYSNPVANAIVSVKGQNSTKTTDASGTFTFENIPITISPTTVEATLANYQKGVAGGIIIYSGLSTSVTFTITPNIGFLAGQITDISNGRGVPGATVRIRGTLMATTTNTNGQYLITDIPISVSGATIDASAPGYTGNSFGPTPIKAGDTTTVNVQLSPNFASIAGRVEDATTGIGLGNAIVRITKAGMTTNTDSDGLYLVRDVPLTASGTTLEAFKAGFSTAYTSNVTVTYGQTTTVNIRLTATTGMIVGAVSDSMTGVGLTGAIVRVAGSSLFATTDTNGSYVISQVEVRTGITVESTASGYAKAKTGGLEVKASSATIVDFAMTITTGSLAGQVYDAVTQNGIAGVFVRISGTILSDTTNSSGVYRLSNVPSILNATVEVQSNGYVNASKPGVNILPGSTTTINVAMTPTSGALTGFVKDVSNGNGIEGALVTVTGSMLIATTADTGSYSFTQVPVASGMTVEVQVSGYSGQSQSGVAIEPGRASTVNFNLTPQTGAIAGKVIDASTYRALPGVTILLSGYQLQTSTGSNGNFLITNLSAISGITLEATLEKYQTYKKGSVVIEGGKMTSLSFTMTPNYGTVSGIVTDSATGLGIQNVFVQLPGAGIAGVSTNSGGYYEMSLVPVSTTGYTVEASKANYQNVSGHTTAITGGDSISLDLSMNSTTGTITGTVTDGASGLGLNDVVINIPAAGIADKRSGQGGFFMITGVAASATGYTLEASLTGYNNASVKITSVTPGQTSSQNFTLTPSAGTVTGTVTDAVTGLGVELVTLVIPGSGIEPKSTGTGGYFEITNIPANTSGVTIEASKTGYVNRSIKSSAIVGGKATALSFSMTPTYGTVAGTVIDAVTKLPLLDVTITLPGTGLSESSKAGGSYEITGVPATAAGVTVEASLANYRKVSGKTAAVDGGKTTILNFQLTKTTGTVAGTIKDAISSLGLSGVLLSIPGSGLPAVYSQEGGIFNITSVPSNIAGVTIDATLADYNTNSSKTAAVNGGESTTHTILMTPNTGIVAGTITNSVSGLGISGVIVIITGGVGKQGTTGISGYFEILDVPVSVSGVTLSATIANYQGTTGHTSALVAGQVTYKDLVLTKISGTLTGTVIDAVSLKPLASVALTVPGTVLSTNTSTSGSYTLTGLEASASGVTVEASLASYRSSKMPSGAITGGQLTNIDFKLTPTNGTLVGQIRDSGTDLGLSGVLVSIPGTNTTTYSAKSGSFSIDLGESSTGVTVEFSKDNFFNLANKTGAINGGNVTQMDLVYLTPIYGTISGTIRDSVSLFGLSSALIAVEGSTSLTALSGIGGAYLVTSVPASATGYTIEVRLNNYTNAKIKSSAVASGSNTVLDILMTPQIGSISGIVRNYASELGLSGAVISIPGLPNTRATSGASGYYELTNVPANPAGVTLSVAYSGFSPLSKHSPAITGGSTQTVNFDLTSTTGTIVGTVDDAQSGLGLSGAIVNAPGLGVTAATTDSSGSYQLYLVPASTGGVTLEVSKSRYATLKEKTAALMGGTVVEKNFSISQVVGSVVGVITDVETRLGVSGVAVSIAGSSIVPSTTSSSGSFIITDVPISTTGITVEASADRYKTASYKVASIAGGQQSQASFDITPIFGIITGSVKDSGSNLGLTNALVRIPGTGLQATSQTGGYYEISNVPENSDGATLEVILSGYESTKVKLSTAIAGGNVYTRDILLTYLYGYITGTVVDSKSSVGLSGVVVKVPGLAVEATTQSGGYYELEQVPVNAAGVTMQASLKNYYIFKGKSSAVAGGAETSFNISMTPSVGNITGTVKDSTTSLGISGAIVRLEGTTIQSSTNTSGYFEFSEVPEKAASAPYLVAATANNYTDNSVTTGAFEGGDTVNVPITLNPTIAVLTGTVTDIISGLGLSGVVVSVPIESVKNVTTGTGGYYEISNVPSGTTFKILFSKDRYVPLSTEVSSIAGGSVGSKSVDLTPAYGTVTGQITDSVQGFPIKDVIVRLPSHSIQGSTAADGVYSITDVPLGKKIGAVEASLSNFAAVSDISKANDTLSVATGMTVTLDLTMTQLYGAVVGQVVDGSAGTPVGYCYVTLSNNNYFLATTTTSSGAFRFTQVPIVTGMTLAASKGSQYLMQTGTEPTIDILPGVTQEAQLQVYANFAATLRVFGTIWSKKTAADANPDPAVGWTVRAMGPGYATVANSNGKFMIFMDDFTGGSATIYTLWLEAVTHEGLADEYATGEFFVVNSASGECNIDINQPNGGSLYIRQDDPSYP
jgi:hypothetical protein